MHIGQTEMLLQYWTLQTIGNELISARQTCDSTVEASLTLGFPPTQTRSQELTMN